VIGRFFRTQKSERNILVALLLQSAGCGFFIALFDLSANVIFLERFGAERVPLAFMISGGAGIVLIAIFNFLRTRMGVSAFGMLNLILVMLLTGVMLTGIFQREKVEFALFVLMGPLILMTLLGFWSTVRGLLQGGNRKQFSGLIEATLIGGMVLGFYAAPFMEAEGMRTLDLLYPGLGGLLLAAVMQLLLWMKTDQKRYPFRFSGPGTGAFGLFSHRYTGLMAAFMIMGAGISVILHYSFLWASGSSIPEGVSLVTFFGFFFGSMMILAWIMKRHLFGWVKKKFGLMTTLLTAPFVLIILTVASALAAQNYGYPGGATTISYFFLMIILSKLMDRTLKDSMEDPSMKIIYQTLDRRERVLAQRGIEGILNQIAVFATGFFLAAVVLISFVGIIHVTYLLLMILFLWVLTGIALYRNYRRLLKGTLESDRLRETSERNVQELAKTDLEQTSFPVEMILFNPYFFHYTSRENLLFLLEHSHAGVRELIWTHLLKSSPGLPDLTLSQMLLREQDPALKDRIRQLGKRRLRGKLGLQEAFIKERLDRFYDERGRPEEKLMVDDAFRSNEKNEVLGALYHVAQERDPEYLPQVVSLLRSHDLNLSSVAISTAALLESDGIGEPLAGFLGHPDLYVTAWSALVSQGERVLDDLEASFHKPGASIVCQKRIISCMAAIGGARSLQLILGKLDYHHREIFHATVRSLYESSFRATEIQSATIQNAILRLVRTGTWNLAAKISTGLSEPEGAIARAMDDEIRDVNGLILMLLAMIYDRRSVQRIQANLQDRDPGNRAIAIELLDLLVKPPLKTLLITYFEDISVREKIDKLHLLFPVEIFPFKPLLTKILNRDGMQLGHFVRICALDIMGRREEFFDEQQILAQGFHPDKRIRETAAQLLRKNDPERYSLVSERPDFPDNSFFDHEDPGSWYIETVLGLSEWELFTNVGLNALFKLVSGLRTYDGRLPSDGNVVILARSIEEGDFSPLSSGIAIIAAHQPELMQQIRYLGAGGKCVAYLIEKEEFIELLFDEVSLLHTFCGILNKNSAFPV